MVDLTDRQKRLVLDELREAGWELAPKWPLEVVASNAPGLVYGGDDPEGPVIVRQDHMEAMQEELDALRGRVSTLTILADWYSREPCENVEPPDEGTCRDAGDLDAEEWCGPCHARALLDASHDPGSSDG